MRGNVHKRLAVVVLVFALAGGNAAAGSSASNDYLRDCAECHGADGKGSQAAKRAVLGYVSVDLTQISQRNGGEFPREKVRDAIDGRNRIAAHFSGDMPRWGQRYSLDEAGSAQAGARVQGRISALVDFIESIQEK